MIPFPSALCLALLAAPQDTGPTLPQGDPRQQIRRLFQEVEQALSTIDVQLADAGAGEVPLEDVADSGLEKLLRDTQQASRDATEKMNRILEIAVQMDGQKSSGGASKDQPSPLDQPRDGAPLDRESTPEAPRGKGQDEPEPQAGEPKPGDEKPQGAGSDKQQGQNGPGKNPAGKEGDPAAHPEDNEPWGFLPQRAREVFRNQGGTDMPVQYRDWIDSYYRRLNTTHR